MLECNHPAHHLRLAGALVVQGKAAGVVAEVPGPHGSDSQTELGAGALTVHAVDPAGLMDVNIVLGPGHLRRGLMVAGILRGVTVTVTEWCLYLQT